MPVWPHWRPRPQRVEMDLRLTLILSLVLIELAIQFKSNSIMAYKVSAIFPLWC